MSETKQSDPERALARLLADALRPSGAAGDSECPDAGFLAAYAEHQLDATEIAHWEEHFAGCARCQKILAVLAVSGEEPLSEAEVQRFGRQVAAASAGRAPSVAGAAGRKAPGSEKLVSFARPRTTWRWLAPAVGIAAAMALWIALRPAPPNTAPATVAQKATGQPSAQPSVPAGDSLIARADVPAPLAAAAREAEPQQPLESLAQPQLQKKESERTARVTQVPLQSASRRQDAGDAQQADDSSPAQAAPALGAKAKASDEVATAAPAPTPAAAPAAETTDAFAAQKAAPPPAASKTAENKAAENRQLQVLAARGSVAGLADRASIVIASPSRTALWRLSPAGQIERSADQGRTWQPQSSGVASDLLAGAAPSDKVAWIAGRAGIILRTTDGEHWQQLPSPAEATDWTAIEAKDALRATVTSADRRRFATEDGGRTWKLQ